MQKLMFVEEDSAFLLGSHENVVLGNWLRLEERISFG